MPLTLAINGYGRIGRCLLRALYQRGGFAVKAPVAGKAPLVLGAINELGDSRTIAHLTRYDSTHGIFAGEVSIDGQSLSVDGEKIRLHHCENIADLPWDDQGIDLVLECTGAFSDRATAEQHVQAGASRVLFSQPADRDVDATVVFGINEHLLRPEHRVISAASCTTNGIVPVIKLLDEALGIDHGLVTTIHSAMNDQPVIDAYHHTDLRKTRSAMQSIIPVDTGLARGIERILPHMAGRFEAHAMRVPTVNVSAMDLTVAVKQNTDVVGVNRILAAAAEKMPTILGYTDEPLASCDFTRDTRSAIVDASQTRVSGQRLVKVLVWFDNEWAYANRMLDVAEAIAALDSP